MTAEELDTPCDSCEMSHGHHHAWCHKLPKSKSDVPPQGKLHTGLDPLKRTVSAPGINASGAPLVAKDVPIGQPK